MSFATLQRAATLARWDHPARLLVDEFVARIAPEVPPNALVLDAAAGESIYARFFGHCRYVACDRTIGDSSWDYTRLDAVADLAALPFRSGTFDAVLCTHALEHVPDPAAVVRELAGVLRPGGRLYLSVPFLGDPIHQEPYDFFRYTPFGLRHLVEQAGLTPVSVTPMGGAYYLFTCFLWWYAVVYRIASRESAAHAGLIRRAARRILAGVMLLSARFSTMLVVRLGQTNTASSRFANGYGVVAEKR